MYEADLVEMIPLAKMNKDYKYILTMNNCFSKYAFAAPFKTKTASEILNTLTPLLKTNKMKHLHTDQVKEWFNPSVKKLLLN